MAEQLNRVLMLRLSSAARGGELISGTNSAFELRSSCSGKGFQMTGSAGSRRGRADAAKRNGSADDRANERVTTVLLVDARAWTREALARGLEVASRDLRVLRFADLSEIPGAELPTGAAVILLTGSGLSDPRVSSAIAATRSSLPETPVVVLSEEEDAEAIVEAVERGLNGYVPMSLELPQVAHALRFVAAGGTFFPAELLLTSLEVPAAHGFPAAKPAGVPTPAAMTNPLTQREVAVLELVGQGKANKQIARDLNVREATVKVHVRHIMRKLGAVNRTQVALLAEGLTS
jgi:two-component system nitrate/nitrite response regulator NarL